MRVVTWNLGYWTPGRFNSHVNRQRQWSFLMSLGPDIASLQECRPNDFQRWLPEWATTEYDIVGALPEPWTACSAVLARRALAPALVTDTKPIARLLEWIRHACSASTSGVRGGVGRQRAHAGTGVDDDVISTADHERMRRTGCERAWHNDMASWALREWVGPTFVLGGDWNIARLFDINYPDDYPNAGGAFFERAEKWGWCESLRLHHASELRTYLDERSDAYALDHVFTDAQLHRVLDCCDVLDDSTVRELSDHAPVVTDFTIEP